ncbi:uncharacterized protein N7483_000314 [Penicillium malachiteum]|uniref:uncharacterized protein n=1 Tax=Penicillium malachiteum TaxID=1324776 RepID=UPI0025499A48|nr:uncharacterized protein N7483_000314 [Penicillium malachiteum]KAJ5735189.1 hypothetical protein N7483_000314 [Penicillium malachiteum]
MRRAHTELDLIKASTADRETKAESATFTQSPTFLLGLFNQTPIENLIAGLPSRQDADTLVAQCLDSGEPSFSMF